MSKVKSSSRINVWLGGIAFLALILAAISVKSDGNDGPKRDQGQDQEAVFEADFTSSKENSATWSVQWGIRHSETYEAEPDAPFSRTLTVRPGQKLRLVVLRSNGADPRMRCALIVNGKRFSGRVLEGGAGCEASTTVSA